MAMSVVPPPMSTSATPSSFSSSVSTDSLAASCSTTVSATLTPARFTHATMFCVELWLPVMMWTLTSSRAPVIPTGAPMPSCSSTTKSCGSTWRISRPVGSDTALAASIARRTSSRVISRFLPATAITPRLLKPLMCGPDSARWTESISTPAISSASSIAFLIESTAASRLTTTPRRMPRDSATPSPTMSSAVAVEHLADDRRHLRRADVEADQVPLFSRHVCLRDSHRLTRLAPASAGSALTPTPAEPCRASLRPASRSDRPDVDPIVEPQIDVVDVGDALAQRLGELEVRLQPRQEPVLADVDHRGIAAQDHRALCRSVTSTCDSRLAISGVARSAAISARRQLARAARRSSRSPLSGRRRQAVDDRQIEIGVLRAVPVDDRRRARRRGTARRRCAPMPIGSRSDDHDFDRRRQRAPQRRVPHPRRRQQPPAPAVEVGPHHVLAAQPVSTASTSPSDSRSLPRTTIRSICSTRACADDRATPR